MTESTTDDEAILRALGKRARERDTDEPRAESEPVDELAIARIAREALLRTGGSEREARAAVRSARAGRLVALVGPLAAAAALFLWLGPGGERTITPSLPRYTIEAAFGRADERGPAVGHVSDVLRLPGNARELELIFRPIEPVSEPLVIHVFVMGAEGAMRSVEPIVSDSSSEGSVKLRLRSEDLSDATEIRGVIVLNSIALTEPVRRVAEDPSSAPPGVRVVSARVDSPSP